MNEPNKCPHCKNDDPSMIEKLGENEEKIMYRCEVCSKYWTVMKKEISYGKN